MKQLTCKKTSSPHVHSRFFISEIPPSVSILAEVTICLPQTHYGSKGICCSNRKLFHKEIHRWLDSNYDCLFQTNSSRELTFPRQIYFPVFRGNIPHTRSQPTFNFSQTSRCQQWTFSPVNSLPTDFPTSS